MSFSFIQDQQHADYLDAMADLIEDQREAMRETDPEDWQNVEVFTQIVELCQRNL